MAPYRELVTSGGSGQVTLDKQDLRQDGLVDEDGEPREDVVVELEREEEKTYTVKLIEESELVHSAD